jgi:hypothetical protein
MSSAHDREAERQRRLVECLLAPQADASALSTREAEARALRGLQAYRANADACAERALATAFATVRMLLGEDDFRQLAREFWRAAPPRCGDLGEWGEALPGWIAAHGQLAEWPYLADAARLDWVLHRCERAADDTPDRASLARLGDTDPAQLDVQFMPGVALVESGWPVGLIHRAHHAGDVSFDAVREAIAARRGEAVLVARAGWKAVPHALDPATAAWTRGLLGGQDLGSALAAAGDGFDFAAWLAAALQSNCLKGIRRRGD